MTIPTERVMSGQGLRRSMTFGQSLVDVLTTSRVHRVLLEDYRQKGIRKSYTKELQQRGYLGAISSRWQGESLS